MTNSNGIKLTFDEENITDIRVDFEDENSVEGFKGLILEPIKMVFSNVEIIDLDEHSMMINCPVGKGEDVLNCIYRTVYALAFISKHVNLNEHPTEEEMQNLFDQARKNIDGKTYKEINDMTAAL